MTFPGKTEQCFIACIVCIAILTSCAPSTMVLDSPHDEPLPVSAQNASTPTSAPQSLPVELPSSHAVLSQTVNDITVDTISAKMTSTGLEVGICYTAPDNGEWRPMPGHLYYANHEIFPDEIEFLPDETIADGTNTGNRCALIRYHIPDLETVVTPIEFSILQFYAPGREMYTPCEELQQRLSTNPKAQSHALKAECTMANDGNLEVTLAGYGPSISREKAEALLMEIASAEVEGPWVFTLHEIER